MGHAGVKEGQGTHKVICTLSMGHAGVKEGQRTHKVTCTLSMGHTGVKEGQRTHKVTCTLSMGHAGVKRKPSNDSAWETLTQNDSGSQFLHQVDMWCRFRCGGSVMEMRTISTRLAPSDFCLRWTVKQTDNFNPQIGIPTFTLFSRV